jgi:hypothetical protein
MRTAKEVQERLRAILAGYEAITGERSDSVKRRALRNTLDAVIRHLQAQAGFHEADIALLVKLGIALRDTENGVSVSYFAKRKRRGPEPDTTNIKIMRGRLAADVEARRTGGFYSRQQAAESILNKIPSNSPVFRGTALRDVKTVLRWHDKIPRMSEKSVERKAYEARLIEKRRRIAR